MKVKRIMVEKPGLFSGEYPGRAGPALVMTLQNPQKHILMINTLLPENRQGIK